MIMANHHHSSRILCAVSLIFIIISTLQLHYHGQVDASEKASGRSRTRIIGWRPFQQSGNKTAETVETPKISKRNSSSPTTSDKDRGWPPWFPKKESSRASNTTTTATTDDGDNNKTNKKKQRRRSRRQKLTEDDEKKDNPIQQNDDNDKSGNVTSTASSSSSNTTDPDDLSDSSSSSNSTAQNQQQQQYQYPKGVVIMGTPLPSGSGNHPYHRRHHSYGRNHPVGGFPSQMVPGGQDLGGGGPPGSALSPNTMVLVEILASILATGMRLWLITWVTKRLAAQEETIHPTQHFVWERLNDRYIRDSVALKTAVQQPPNGVSFGLWKRKKKVLQAVKKRHELSRDFDWTKTFSRTVVVVEINSEPKLDVEFLGDVVTFLLHQHRSHAFGTSKETGDPMELEVVFLVQSPGGSVAQFGLAASQVQRLVREPGISTSACVDRYAASGGYMISSQVNKLYAAPFATVGSIGVIMEGLNFHELAKTYGVKPLIVKSSDAKHSLSTFGEVTEKDLNHERERLLVVYEQFKELILKGRPQLAGHLDKVADGSVFVGEEALGLKLVDAIKTSDEYLFERVEAGDRVLKLHRSHQAKFSRRLAGLSPMDVIPHIKSWVSDKVRLAAANAAEWNQQDLSSWVSRIVQTGSLLKFAQYLVRTYGGRGAPPSY